MANIIPELGAAGCGHPESRCEHLTSTLFGFSCKKYDADLKLWKGEPLRLRKCGDDAHDEWAKYRAEQRKKRGGDETAPQPHPQEVGEMIDQAIKALEGDERRIKNEV